MFFPCSRLAYLQDVRFFFDYLISNTSLTDADVPKNIKLDEIRELTSMDVNLFIDFCRKYTVDDGDKIIFMRIITNSRTQKVFCIRHV